MPDRVEQLLADSLQDRADTGSPIDPVPFMHAAATRGRRIRLRRRVAGGLLAAVVAGAGVYGVTTTRRAAPVDGPTPSSPTQSSSPVGADLARLPPAAADGAITRPDLVGSDLRTLHFAVDEMAGQSRRVTYRVTSGYESADVQRWDYQAFVAVSREEKKLPPPESFLGFPQLTIDPPVPARIGDLPATLTVGRSEQLSRRMSRPDTPAIFSLIWQPVPGLWANVQVQTTSLEQALRIVGQVRFDQARRCALPFRLETPPGSSIAECTVALVEDQGHLFGEGGLTFSNGPGTLFLRATNNWMHAGMYPRSLKAGKYRVDKDPTTPYWTMTTGDLLFDGMEQGKLKTYSQQQILRTFSTIELARSVEDPATWF